VAIRVERHSDRRMAEPLLDDLGVDSRLQSKVACVWRKSCALIAAKPALFLCASNHLENRSGWIHDPSCRVATRPVSWYPSPQSIRSSNCVIRHRRRRRVVSMSSEIDRRAAADFVVGLNTGRFSTSTNACRTDRLSECWSTTARDLCVCLQLGRGQRCQG
jgi:hypothetical protein